MPRQLPRPMQRPPLAPDPRADSPGGGGSTSAERHELALAAWRRFGPMVHRTLSRMLGSDEEVRDLSQEAFLQLYQSALPLRTRKLLRPFVDGIAMNLARGEIRRRRVRSEQLLVPGQGPLRQTSTSADPEAREVMASLLRLVGRLGPADREMFVLREIERLEQTDICSATNLSISTVRRRLRRLRRRIESLLHADPALAPYADRARRHGS